MNAAYKIKSGKLYRGGNELLRYRIKIPYIDGAEAINRFYREIAENCELFCKDRLYKRLCQDISHDRDRFVYELISEISHFDENVLSIVMSVSLKNNRSELFYLQKAQSFDLSDGMLLPPKMLCKKYSKKGEKIKKSAIQNAFLRSGVIDFLKN